MYVVCTAACRMLHSTYELIRYANRVYKRIDTYFAIYHAFIINANNILWTLVCAINIIINNKLQRSTFVINAHAHSYTCKLKASHGHPKMALSRGSIWSHVSFC